MSTAFEATATSPATQTADAGSSPRKVLLVGFSGAEADELVPFLDRNAFATERLPRAHAALPLLAHVAFDLIIVRFPTAGIDTAEFLDAMRSPAYASQRAPLAALTAPPHLEAAAALVGHGVNRVLNLSDGAEALQGMLAGILDVAPRRSARLGARIEVRFEGHTKVAIAATHNISATGMLLETDLALAPGSRIAFEFILGHRPASGVADVVRKTVPGRDPVQGYGLRFRSFNGDSEERYRRFLARLA